MTQQKQYGLLFKVVKNIHGIWPVCDINLSFNGTQIKGLSPSIAIFIQGCDEFSTNYFIDKVDKVLDGSWNIEQDGDSFINDFESSIWVDVDNLEVYFEKGSFTDGLERTMPLQDFKALLEEWRDFIKSVDNPLV